MDNSNGKLKKFGLQIDTKSKFNRYFTILLHNNTHHLNFYLPSSKFNLIFLHGTKNFRLVLNKTDINNFSNNDDDDSNTIIEEDDFSDTDETNFITNTDSLFNSDTCFDTSILTNHNAIDFNCDSDDMISSNDENSLDDNTPYKMQKKIADKKKKVDGTGGSGDNGCVNTNNNIGHDDQNKQQKVPIKGAELIEEQVDTNIWEIPQNDYRTVDFSESQMYSVDKIINLILIYNIVYIKNFNSSHFSLLQNISNKWSY